MTIGEWLEAREPAPPAELRARLRELLGSALDQPDANAPHALLTAAEQLLGAARRDGTAGREQAIDLLAIDAIVTYAFEAAAADPGALPAIAGDAMRRIAALGS